MVAPIPEFDPVTPMTRSERLRRAEDQREQKAREQRNGHAATEPVYLPPERFALTWFRETPESVHVDWIIKNMLDRGKLCQLFGQSQSGKSYLALDLCLSVVRGVPWMGQRTVTAPCLYVAAEASKGLGRRIRAYQLHHGCEDDDLYFAYISDAPDMLSDDDVTAIIAKAKELTEIAETPLALVVLDTVRDSMSGDDSSNQDMAAYHAGCKRIIAETGAAVVAINHTGHGELHRARGASAGFAAVDWEYRCESQENPRALTCTKDRETGNYGHSVAFNVTPVVLCQDQDGDDETSCVIEQTETQPKVNGKAGKPITGAAGVALKMLTKAIDEAGEDPPPSNHIPQGVKIVSLALWGRYCAQAGLSKTGTPDAERQALHRAKTSLQNRQAIGVWNDCVWTA